MDHQKLFIQVNKAILTMLDGFKVFLRDTNLSNGTLLGLNLVQGAPI